jgi:hypothetical protein
VVRAGAEVASSTRLAGLISCNRSSNQYHGIKFMSEQSTPVMVRLSPEQIKALDDWRRKEEDIPGRPEAIRRLVELGLKKGKRG